MNHLPSIIFFFGGYVSFQGLFFWAEPFQPGSMIRFGKFLLSLYIYIYYIFISMLHKAHSKYLLAIYIYMKLFFFSKYVHYLIFKSKVVVE